MPAKLDFTCDSLSKGALALLSSKKFYGKVANISDWTAKKLKLQTLSREEAWKKKYPNIAEKINNLEDKIKYLDRIHMNDGK